MNAKDPAVLTGAWPGCLDDHALLMRLLTGPDESPTLVLARPWAAPVRLMPLPHARSVPASARRSVRPLTGAATLLLAGSLVAASVGATPAFAEPHDDPAPPVALVTPPPPTGGTLADRLVVADTAAQADHALLTHLLVSTPPVAAAPAPSAAVSFATVAKLPAAAYTYSQAVVQLPMITLDDNAPPPPPPPAAIVVAQPPPPPPSGYVQPPGYQDGVLFGGQVGAARTVAVKPATTKPVTTQPATLRPATYIVRVGDTLSGIALRFYGNAAYATAIWQANARLLDTNLNLIFVGDRLTLPGIASPVVSAAVPLPARGVITQHARYTIQPRDFLRWMAQRAYGTEVLWPQIYHANRNVLGANPDLIYPQVTVYIP